jgi:hypothetical protein
MLLDLNIPPEVLQHILPSQKLSINQFLAFKIPPPARVPAKLQAAQISIAAEPPKTGMEEIYTILSAPVPLPVVVKDLLDCITSSSPVNPTAKSITYNLDSVGIKNLPLWVITYWNEVHHLHEDRQCWISVNQTLQDLCVRGADIHELVGRVYAVLDRLPWFGSVHGFSQPCNIVDLHQYATSNWLRTVHEDQMLDLLQHDISNHHMAPKTITIRDTDFVPAILRAFDRRDHQRQRGKNTRPAAFRVIGESLASGNLTQLGTVVNTQQTHWFALVLDFLHHIIWYGDSLGWKVEAKIQVALKWWIEEYTSRTFTYKRMSVTHQRDSFSCGLLAGNALSHYFLPIMHPLIDLSDVAVARIKVLLRVCERHHSGVSCFQAELNYLPIMMQGGSSCNLAYEYSLRLPNLNTLSSDEESDSDFEMGSVHMFSDAGYKFPQSPEHRYSSEEESSLSEYSSEDKSTLVMSGGLPADTLQDRSPVRKSETGSSVQLKVKIESSVRAAVGAKKAPLLNFFKPCTLEEFHTDLAREQETMQRAREDDEALEKVAKERRLLEKREKATLRQRKHRLKKMAKEVITGVRSPRGTKRKVIPIELTDSGLSKKRRLELAEETRPARLLKRKIKENTRKPQGRKAKNMSRQATYYNWFSPISWRLIEEAAKAAGWRMSATQIVRIAKTRNPAIFEDLSRETVRDWIDRSGPQPRWSDSTLIRAKAGNIPGHANGGARGILVSSMSIVRRMTH